MMSELRNSRKLLMALERCKMNKPNFAYVGVMRSDVVIKYIIYGISYSHKTNQSLKSHIRKI